MRYIIILSDNLAKVTVNSENKIGWGKKYA
jgi:hypothetical protein